MRDTFTTFLKLKKNANYKKLINNTGIEYGQ